jgi:hypothetical protein
VQIKLPILNSAARLNIRDEKKKDIERTWLKNKVTGVNISAVQEKNRQVQDHRVMHKFSRQGLHSL